MITALSLHGFVFPPHCNASTRHVTVPAIRVAPTKSSDSVCWSRSRVPRLVGSDPRGGDDLSSKMTAVTETPPIGRLMKKHQRWVGVVIVSYGWGTQGGRGDVPK